MSKFLREIFQFWKETWHNDKKLFWCEAIGVVLGIWSASYLAFYPVNPNMWVVLMPWGISAIFMAYSSYLRRSAWLVMLMSIYAVNNFVGVINLTIQTF